MVPPLRRTEPDVTASVQIKGKVGLKLYTIFIYNVRFLKVRFDGVRSGAGQGREVTKEKERRKRKSEETEKRRREKSNGCTLSFYNGYFGDSFRPKKTVGRTRSIWR